MIPGRCLCCTRRSGRHPGASQAPTPRRAAAWVREIGGCGAGGVGTVPSLEVAVQCCIPTFAWYWFVPCGARAFARRSQCTGQSVARVTWTHAPLLVIRCAVCDWCHVRGLCPSECPERTGRCGGRFRLTSGIAGVTMFVGPSVRSWLQPESPATRCPTHPGPRPHLCGITTRWPVWEPRACAPPKLHPVVRRSAEAHPPPRPTEKSKAPRGSVVIHRLVPLRRELLWDRPHRPRPTRPGFPTFVGSPPNVVGSARRCRLDSRRPAIHRLVSRSLKRKSQKPARQPMTPLPRPQRKWRKRYTL